MFQVIGKTEGFNVFLETGGDLMVIPPEAVTGKFGSEAGIDVLYLAQLGESTFGCAGV
jgi:hypothetical protein